MGQLQGSMFNSRVEFDEKGNNGLIIMDKYLPEELLGEILFRVDHKTLLSCQMVCKRWHSIIRNYIWRKKAEAVIGWPLQSDKEISWLFHYVICSKKSLHRNLLKNHSGRYGKHKYWNILSEGGNEWDVECPPIGAPPLPISEPVFEGKQHCFVTSYYSCSKEQTVDLVAQGLLPHLLDEIQPTITVSEWYCSRCDCPAIYECSAKLINEAGVVFDTYEFRDTIRDEKQNKWHYVEHEFTNYGPGLRKVTFYHGGMDQNFWVGHYGSKMAGACVKVTLPKHKYVEKENEEEEEEEEEGGVTNYNSDDSIDEVSEELDRRE